jgi:hypothetical protein
MEIQFVDVSVHCIFESLPFCLQVLEEEPSGELREKDQPSLFVLC